MINSLRKKINLYRRYGYWREAECVYIHVPKAAGTSINNALYGRTLGHYTAQEIKSAFPRLFQQSFTFAFVRNPWDRVLSAYRFAKQGGTSSMRIYKPERYQIPEFNSFERFVLDWLPRQDVFSADYVFMPQYEFVASDDGKILVDFIGKIEKITCDKKTVEACIGRSLPLDRMNSTNENSSYVDFYKSEEMIDIVRRVYKKDISMFGYDF